MTLVKGGEHIRNFIWRADSKSVVYLTAPHVTHDILVHPTPVASVDISTRNTTDLFTLPGFPIDIAWLSNGVFGYVASVDEGSWFGSWGVFARSTLHADAPPTLLFDAKSSDALSLDAVGIDDQLSYFALSTAEGLETRIRLLEPTLQADGTIKLSDTKPVLLTKEEGLYGGAVAIRRMPSSSQPELIFAGYFSSGPQSHTQQISSGRCNLGETINTKKQLSHHNDTLSAKAKVVRTIAFQWKSENGEELEGTICLPSAYRIGEEGPLPTVLHPHGGELLQHCIRTFH